MKEEWDKYVDIDGERLKICTKIKLYRKCETEFPFRFSEKEKQIYYIGNQRIQRKIKMIKKGKVHVRF